MTRRFTVIFENEEEDGYHVFCPVLPGCHTQSETIEEGFANAREAIQLYVESLVEDGLRVPHQSRGAEKPVGISWSYEVCPA